MKGWTMKMIEKTGLPYKIIGSGEKAATIASEMPKRNKMGNVWTWVDGIKFQSKKEACRYSELKILEKLGEVSDIKLQVEYVLSVCSYVADFVYKDKNGVEITEDVKSNYTRKLPVYALKKKLMKAELNIVIKEY